MKPSVNTSNFTNIFHTMTLSISETLRVYHYFGWNDCGFVERTFGTYLAIINESDVIVLQFFESYVIVLQYFDIKSVFNCGVKNRVYNCDF